MFNLNNSQNNNENSNEKNLKSEWLNFSSKVSKDDFLETVAAENKFLRQEMKIRSMVIDMLEKEFGKDIKNIKGYNFLVDSVVNKLKKKQLGTERYVNETAQ